MKGPCLQSLIQSHDVVSKLTFKAAKRMWEDAICKDRSNGTKLWTHTVFLPFEIHDMDLGVCY